MRCPKCNYVSFDHLDNCKKCGNDLQAVKAELGWTDEMPGPIAFFEDKLTTEETVDQGMDSTEPDAVVDTVGQTGDDLAFADTELSIDMGDDDGIQLDAMDDMLDDDMIDTEEPASMEAIEIDQDDDGIALDMGDIMDESQDTNLSDESQISSSQDNEEIPFEELETEEPLGIDDEIGQETISIEEDSADIISMDIENGEGITEIYDQDGFEDEITSEISGSESEEIIEIDDEAVDSEEEFNIDDDQTLVYSDEIEETETSSIEQEDEGGDEEIISTPASETDETMVIELDEGQELVLTDSEESSADSIAIEDEIEENIELQDEEDVDELVFDIADDDDGQDIDTDSTVSISQEDMENIANDIDSIENNNFDDDKDDDEDFIELLDE